MNVKAPTQNKEGVNDLFDAVMKQQGLRNDAKLSLFLQVAPPVISKMRHGILPVGPSMILNLHERAGLPVSVIREYLALEVTK